MGCLEVGLDEDGGCVVHVVDLNSILTAAGREP